MAVTVTAACRRPQPLTKALTTAMQRHFLFLFLIAASLLAAACSAQSWYAGVQAGAENECRKQPGSAAQECLARLNKQAYQEYEKERTQNK